MSQGIGVFSVSTEEVMVAAQNEFTSLFDIDADLDFVSLFPPELTAKLFTYLPFKDVMNCCKTCIAWRQAINSNIHWKERCERYGWFDKSKETGTDYMKWRNTPSHASPEIEYRFWITPLFGLPPVASTRIEPLCDWALYFRQCLHLKRNWQKGRYVIHKFRPPSSDYTVDLCNSAACDQKFAVLGSSSGSTFVWSIIDVPKLIGTIHPVRLRVEVEKVRMGASHLVILYQIGLVRIYNLNNQSENLPDRFELVGQFRVWGTPTTNEHEYTLQTQGISEEQFTHILENGDDDDVEVWIRELFREDPWLDTEFVASDMLMEANKEYLVISGLSCQCFLVWLLKTGAFLKKVVLVPTAQVCYKMCLTENKLFLSTRKVVANRIFDATYSNFVYSLTDTDNFLEIPTTTMTEEIQIDKDEKRIVWLSQDTWLSAMDITTQAYLFRRETGTYVDNVIVHGSYVIYHKFDGHIVALDWTGETVYSTEAHSGIIRGLCACNDFLVSGGDAMQLCVWDVHTGKKFHTVHHQPSRIEYLFVDETKVVTFGREDSPVLIGYW